MRYHLMFALLLVAVITSGCKDPLEEGCQYAAGLTKSCGVRQGGNWDRPVDGFAVEELGGDSLVTAAAEALSAETERLNRAVGPLAARSTLDALDLFMLRRYLFMYAAPGSLNDCVLPGKRDSIVAFVTAKDPSGYLHLQYGPPSKLTAKVFESVFASAELRAKLETDLARVIPNAAEAKAAADAVFSAMRNQLSTDEALGVYRYLLVRSPSQLWPELQRKGFVSDECNGKRVAQGVVVVGLDKRDRLVERATGANFKAELSGKVDAAKLDQVVATAEATLSAEIRRQSNEMLKVTLDRPAIVPLRWKPDRM